MSMGVLNSLFRSTKMLVKKAEHDDESILKSWNDYKETVREKEQIIRKLPDWFGQRKAPIARLQELLDLELVDIYVSEKEEEDLISVRPRPTGLSEFNITVERFRIINLASVWILPPFLFLSGVGVWFSRRRK